ncbi:MAG: PorT family protein [Bacteroidales bacterium]|nr:PorT family protein [Bacteroidales bacterium]
MQRFPIILIVVGLFFSVQAFSQVKFGFKAGGNVCNMKFNIDSEYGDEPETKVKMGFHVGLITDISLSENTLSLQPSLLFSNKGYSIDFEEMLDDEFDDEGIDMDDYEGYARMNFYYIELPINFVYKINGFQVSAGPYVALGIGGKFKHDFSFEADGEDFNSDDYFDEDTYKLKPIYGKVDDDIYEDYLDDEDIIDLYRAFDYGLNFGIGYQVKSVLFNVGYSLGLGNLTPAFDADYYDMDEDYTKNVIQKNRVISFSVSYFLIN